MKFLNPLFSRSLHLKNFTLGSKIHNPNSNPNFRSKSMAPSTVDATDSKGYETHPIRGMNSVVATVSGYHGQERSKLIKLIAHTGANYVGKMNKSISHLVCWRFEGKKFDLARQLGTCIISHRFFEDCLKHGKRLPEGPYTMQSGQEAGPISWDFPAPLDTRGKEKTLLKKKRNALCDLSNSSDVNEEEDFTASYFDIPCSDWSLSPLLKEPEDSSSSLPMCSSNNKINFCGGSRSDIAGRPSRRSRCLVKKRASDNPINLVILDSQPTESHNLQDNNPFHVDLKKLSSMNVPSTQELISDITSTVSEESRREALESNEDMGEQHSFHISTNSHGFRNCSLSSPGTSQTEHLEHNQVGTDFCDVGDNKNEQSNNGDMIGEKSCPDSETGLSCVICWTDFSSIRGVLPCGHWFCYPCIQEWADCLVATGRISTCPLCKTKFSRSQIGMFGDTSLNDQKIYSQTIPSDASNTDIYMLSSSRLDHHDTWPSNSVCYKCHNREPVDLLTCCHICQNKRVHSYCLDPPLDPWTCDSCKDLRSLYQRFHRTRAS